VIRIDVPGIPPSPNVTRRRAFSYFVYRDLRKRWVRDIFAKTDPRDRRLLIEAAQVQKMRVRLTIFHSRDFDEDNLQACQKPVLDAMRELGYLKDDSRKWLQLERALQVRCTRAEAHTLIEIEPLFERPIGAT